MPIFEKPATAVEQQEKERQPSLEQQIHEAKKEGRLRLVGTGSTGTIEILTQHNEKMLPWVIKTRLEEPPSHKKEKKTFATEWEMHQRSFDAISKAAHNAPFPYATIPTPIATVESTNSKRLIIEYIDGETLFERALRFALLRYASEDEQGSILKLGKEALISLASSEAYIGIFSQSTQSHIRWALQQPSGTIPPLSEEHFDDILEVGQKMFQNIPLISRAQYLKIRRTIQKLHSNNIAHGDFHPSNVMLQKDGGIAIIDFGLASIAPSPKSKKRLEDSNYLNIYKTLSL